MSDSALDFSLRLARAYAVLTRRLDSALSTLHGLSFGDFMVLHHLQRAPGRKLRRIDLAERLGLTASGVTRTLLPLEKMGLVGRQPDPRDARVGYAALTDAGAGLYADALVAARTVAHEATQDVSDAQLAELADALGRLAGILPSNA